ncbi:MAG: DNA-binding protein [Gammaproteobacteria bacterium]|nr:DNA-binding protein [Gammaproteobacteria bacterium]
MINQDIADKLLEIATLLKEQGANPYRVSAYQNAANVIFSLPQPVGDIVAREGIQGLVALPGIGEGIARSIYEYLALGRMSRLESLKGGHDPVALFEAIPGIGPKLAHRIIENLHIDSLEALEVAAHNQRLEKIPGFSPKKVAMVQVWLAQVLGRQRPRPQPHEPFTEPSVKLILQVDQQYRQKASAAELPMIVPKRFNPEGKAWLPVMHVTKQGWHFTALFSNTARAHQLNRTQDWVVIYFYDDQHHESQHTVVTETHGALTGQRVVRGRETECREYYASVK